MTIPRIARIHLVYQFIILTLLVFAIGYNEILPDKKYLFLALIPVFCYQVMIVFCCTELLPLPYWINVQEYARRSTKSEDTLIETKGPRAENVENVQTVLNSTESVFPKKLSSFKYTLKSRKTDIPTNNKILESQEINACGREVLNNIKFPETNFRQSELETTKSYYFPYRQKRTEEWIDKQKDVRPYKVRNVKSGYGEKSPTSPIHKSPTQIRREEDNKMSLPIESGNENEIEEKEPSDLKKSYSFPFRQKKLEKSLACEENVENDLSIQMMPPWKALNYSKSANPCEGRRKSFSTEALHKELKLIKSSCEQKERNDFTQSMELTGNFNLDACAVKRNSVKSTTSFNKFKQGIVNCFYKNKRESLKTNETKQNDENRKFFKELFLSNESLNFEYVDKEEPANKVKSIKAENKNKLGELFQPSYVSYASDSFTDDVKVYSHPKNFKK